MFEDFYQLSTNPFRLAPDPDFCFSHSGYQGAREYLEYALNQGEGFVMVTGRPGTGKTMLVETFLREIDTSRVIAKRIAVSHYGADELLRAVAYAYDIDVAELDKATLRHLIQQYFLQQEQAGRRVLLIMDEAQALQHTAMEELRILADLQTESRTMLQLFLVGQESLQSLMSTPDMEQFQQRVIANYHLIPLNLMDTRAYIEHRLLQAGWSGDPEFTSAAVLAIYQLSRGVPRHINKICNRLLLLGFGKGSYIFHKEDVQAISTEMRDELLTPMESGSTLQTDAYSIANIPEIRDGVIALADLAIRVDKVDARVFAICEASRLAAKQKEQFIARHHDDPATWYPHKPLPADPVEDAVAVTAEQMSGSTVPAPDNHHHASTVAERFLSHLKWRETLVVTAATLAITTISIAALPSLLGNAPAQDALSHTAHSPVEIQDTNTSGSGSTGDDASADVLIAGLATAPVSVMTPVPDEGEQPVTRDVHEDDVLVVAVELADSPVIMDDMPVSVDGSNLVSNAPVSLPSPLIEWQAPAGDVSKQLLPGQDPQPMPVASAETAAVIAMHGQYEAAKDGTVAGDLSEETPAPGDDRLLIARVHSADADFQQVSGDINRASSLQQPTPVAAGPVQAAAVAETAGATDASQDETIAELLSLGEQSLDDYRLLTPEDDNAYAYFNAVLRLDPASEDARAGIREIVDLYLILARKAAGRGANDRAGRYIDRALSIQPGNRALLALKEDIDRNSGSASTRTAAAARRESASQGSVSTREQAMHERMMSRISTFLNNRKAEAERGEVRIPVGWDG